MVQIVKSMMMENTIEEFLKIDFVQTFDWDIQHICTIGQQSWAAFSTIFWCKQIMPCVLCGVVSCVCVVSFVVWWGIPGGDGDTRWWRRIIHCHSGWQLFSNKIFLNYCLRLNRIAWTFWYLSTQWIHSGSINETNLTVAISRSKR